MRVRSIAATTKTEFIVARRDHQSEWTHEGEIHETSQAGGGSQRTGVESK